jgi:hypothetical protein
MKAGHSNKQAAVSRAPAVTENTYVIEKVM